MAAAAVLLDLPIVVHSIADAGEAWAAVQQAGHNGDQDSLHYSVGDGTALQDKNFVEGEDREGDHSLADQAEVHRGSRKEVGIHMEGGLQEDYSFDPY
jgi:hypothetical protein